MKFKIVKKEYKDLYFGSYYRVMIKKWFFWIPYKVECFYLTQRKVLKKCMRFKTLEAAEKHLEEIKHTVEATTEDGRTIRKIFNWHGLPIYIDSNNQIFTELTNALNNNYEF